MDEDERAGLIRACRDMLADGADSEDVLAIIRTASGDIGTARDLIALIFGVEAQAAHEMIADSATWSDRRAPMLDGHALDDFQRGD